MNLPQKFRYRASFQRGTEVKEGRVGSEEQFIFPEELFSCMPRKYPFDQTAPTNRNSARPPFLHQDFSPFLLLFLPTEILSIFLPFLRALNAIWDSRVYPPEAETSKHRQNFKTNRRLIETEGKCRGTGKHRRGGYENVRGFKGRKVGRMKTFYG